MTTKKKSTETLLLYLIYNETEEIIEDTYGCDGKYTGFTKARREFYPRYFVREIPKEWDYKHLYEQVEVSKRLFKKPNLILVVNRYTDGGTFGSCAGNHQILTVTDNIRYVNKIKENHMRWAEKHNFYMYGYSHFEKHEDIEEYVLAVI